MDNLATLFPISKGITAIVGSGGKTTLAHTLASQLDGTVIFTTTTRIFPSNTMPVYVGNDENQVVELLKLHKKISIGTKVDGGKLAEPTIPFHRLTALADYVIVEADGSKNLPLKAHRDFEPVIPPGTNRRILVAGASGFGGEIGQVCHCPQQFASLANCQETHRVTPEILATVLKKEALGDLVMVNQCETKEQVIFAKKLVQLLDIPLIYGSLQHHHWNPAEF
ncbi:MAG: selenium cofactor biosynthesis protein YqeC [Eubacteriales bacterium]